MRIGSYNVLIPRTDRLEKSGESWKERRASVVDTIDSGFDLIGLQECSTAVNHGQSSYLTDELFALGWTGYLPWKNKLFADEFHERLPIFWRPELFELLEAGQLLLSSWTEEELAAVPILENRYGSFVKLRMASGATLWFYTLHLQHQRAGASEIECALALAKREESERVIARHIRENRRETDAVIVGGDFNTTQLSRGVLEAVGLEDVSQRAESVLNWNQNSFHDWLYPEEGLHIDHVLAAGPLRVTEAAVLLSSASDHYPVRATLAPF